MFNQRIFIDKYKETKEFSNSLLNFVIANNQININEEMSMIYNEYDAKLRNIFRELVDCEKNKEIKNNICIDNFKNQFDELRSDISKKIQKLSVK